MDYSYYLLSAAGVDVIIIPELDCRINIIDTVRDGVDQRKGDQIVYAEVLNQKLAFQAAGPNRPDAEDLMKAINWYRLQKTNLLI